MLQYWPQITIISLMAMGLSKHCIYAEQGKQFTYQYSDATWYCIRVFIWCFVLYKGGFWF